MKAPEKFSRIFKRPATIIEPIPEARFTPTQTARVSRIPQDVENLPPLVGNENVSSSGATYGPSGSAKLPRAYSPKSR